MYTLTTTAHKLKNVLVVHAPNSEQNLFHKGLRKPTSYTYIYSASLHKQK